MYFARGTPVIYYGDEQGFVGDGGDKLARQDMFPSLVPEYNDDDLIGTNATTADDNFDPTHPLYQALAGYATVRQARRCIGAQIHRYSNNTRRVHLLKAGRKISICWRSTTPRPPARRARHFYGAVWLV
jgi:glycosidase